MSATQFQVLVPAIAQVPFGNYSEEDPKSACEVLTQMRRKARFFQFLSENE